MLFRQKGRQDSILPRVQANTSYSSVQINSFAVIVKSFKITDLTPPIELFTER